MICHWRCVGRQCRGDGLAVLAGLGKQSGGSGAGAENRTRPPSLHSSVAPASRRRAMMDRAAVVTAPPPFHCQALGDMRSRRPRELRVPGAPTG